MAVQVQSIAGLARRRGVTERAVMPASGESIGMHYRDALPQQRARCIAEMFHERTANESEPLSRERIQEIIQGIVAELEEESRRESGA